MLLMLLFSLVVACPADHNCKGSITSVLINGNVKNSHTFESPSSRQLIAKITPLQQFLNTPAEADNVSVTCDHHCNLVDSCVHFIQLTFFGVILWCNPLRDAATSCFVASAPMDDQGPVA